MNNDNNSLVEVVAVAAGALLTALIRSLGGSKS